MSVALSFSISPAFKTHFPQGTLGLDMVHGVTILAGQPEAIDLGLLLLVSLTNGNQCWATAKCPGFCWASVSGSSTSSASA